MKKLNSLVGKYYSDIDDLKNKLSIIDNYYIKDQSALFKIGMDAMIWRKGNENVEIDEINNSIIVILDLNNKRIISAFNTNDLIGKKWKELSEIEKDFILCNSNFYNNDEKIEADRIYSGILDFENISIKATLISGIEENVIKIDNEEKFYTPFI